mmetsp:Transcript_11914/g.39206  ORF Transcript_11914/g.39206 Transcript_11914/m.39206 type:complete len:358 (+) Transcript_11914:142-1215(+)
MRRRHRLSVILEVAVVVGEVRVEGVGRGIDGRDELAVFLSDAAPRHGLRVVRVIGHPRHRMGFVFDVGPAFASEEGVAFEGGAAAFDHAEALGRFVAEQPSDHLLAVGAHRRRVLHPCVGHHEVHERHLFLCGVWHFADHHLVKDDAERPPIRGAVVPDAAPHLGREVDGGAAKRVRLVLRRSQVLCEPKVAQFEVPLRVNEQILGFEVAVDDVLAVQKLEDEDDLRAVEARNLLRAHVVVHKVVQVGALDEIHHKVEVPHRFGGADDAHDRGVSEGAHDLLLADGVLHEPALDDELHGHNLERVVLFRLVVIHLVHAAEAADAETATELERSNVDASIAPEPEPEVPLPHDAFEMR